MATVPPIDVNQGSCDNVWVSYCFTRGMDHAFGSIMASKSKKIVECKGDINISNLLLKPFNLLWMITYTRQSGTRGSVTGVGLSIGYPTEVDGTTGLLVISAAPGGPTYRAGFLSGNIILQIDNTMGIYDAADLLQGSEGSSVQLTVRSGPEVKHFALTREKVTINPVKSRLCEVPSLGKENPRIGYIKLSTFDQNASVVPKDRINFSVEANEGSVQEISVESNEGSVQEISFEANEGSVQEISICGVVEGTEGQDDHPSNLSMREPSNFPPHHLQMVRTNAISTGIGKYDLNSDSWFWLPFSDIQLLFLKEL
ncbi:hypothetical protein ACFE04_025781 [Oxalis oulophora]